MSVLAKKAVEKPSLFKRFLRLLGAFFASALGGLLLYLQKKRRDMYPCSDI